MYYLYWVRPQKSATIKLLGGLNSIVVVYVDPPRLETHRLGLAARTATCRKKATPTAAILAAPCFSLDFAVL